MFQNQYYQELDVLSVNAAKLRNYYVPFRNLTEAFEAKDRTDSSKFRLLDGEWAFDFYPSIHEIPVEFSAIPQLPLTKEIPVPSCIQNHGYDAHQYVNVSFPIPYDPPYTPYDNPCGIYRRSFELESLGDEAYYLNFEGVDSNLYLWVNGQFVGYDQVTHSNSEFDVSAYLKKGTNELTVLVMKWCVGTYFEDQDKFRTTGITRSVYLVTREKAGIWDYKIETPVDLAKQTGTLSFTTPYEGEVSYTLFDPQGNQLLAGTGKKEFSLIIEDCAYWTAETPTLYTLIIEAKGEYIREKIGFREFTIQDRVLYLNGQPIKLYGVNHHDSHPDLGPSLLKSDYYEEMLKMKALHMNGIRTAHYPKSPEFYELADEMGFYVISEADVESHGVVNLVGASADYNLMARDEQFGPIIMDRIIRSVIPFQNRPSIFMWSMQNESGYGVNYEQAQKKVRELDPTRLIHNERAAQPDLFRENDFSNLDVISRMYSSFEDVVRYCESSAIKKPFMQCEYAHAMGNGPGDLADYFQLMEKYPSFIGGFVWEWADHAMYLEDENGQRVLGYGGDFGETLHDSNFCVDGLIFPDRSLTSSAIEYRNIHSPIQLKGVKNDRITLRNIQSFLTGTAFSAELSIHVNGEKRSDLPIDLTQLAPLSEVEISFEYPQVTTADYVTVDLILFDNQGEIVARQQKMIQEAKEETTIAICDLSIPSLRVRQEQSYYKVEGTDFSYTFNARTGSFEQLNVDDEALLVAPSFIHIWRAPIDNDRHITSQWRQAGYEAGQWNVIAMDIIEEATSVTFRGSYRLGMPSIQHILVMDLTVTIDNFGEIQYDFDVKKGNNLPDMPRFGVVFPLKKAFNKAKYLGYGPYDSYIDKHYASHFGQHEQEISAMFENYLKPQENGNHWKTVKADIIGPVMYQITSPKPFNFSFIPYSATELTNAAHSYDLPEISGHYLTIDYKQNGIGSYSCGPYLKEKYRFNDEQFKWTFAIKVSR
ncbi:glycoside hydrolase family 42 [Enterococcus alcedinis]|uniref:Beta-galactosidase n=2 Tax=Enterococcus alcedinis TaxID=1274384 RepID=A0A917JEU5_9ENTE|nr:glycoside hydrolase family 2 TIM barrel-domain containing protein [Enterococcus alcedinis]MBP2101785.1 beta-galactosidase [Enterococcus alcedinis]GGI65349.1 glycoside hydrolase family 42 [Enterococcus alcedinis]